MDGERGTEEDGEKRLDSKCEGPAHNPCTLPRRTKVEMAFQIWPIKPNRQDKSSVFRAILMNIGRV